MGFQWHLLCSFCHKNWSGNWVYGRVIRGFTNLKTTFSVAGVAGGSNEGNIATTQKNLTTATCLHHCHCMSRLASKKLAPPPSTNPQELFQYHFWTWHRSATSMFVVFILQWCWISLLCPYIPVISVLYRAGNSTVFYVALKIPLRLTDLNLDNLPICLCKFMYVYVRKVCAYTYM